ncbi:uncharacterized protein SCHCODRAFT_02720027 [Schizophyllum commune H4-8]|uniref:CDR ABC transporter domain-containing protein n=1 Tax=Schizophyllum commune (strain H4-8 / FGSC 9210) TaxID=578458 RepID=D8QM60_SCHCM|nr:uncharacterized protein SCHCODRAFT_02720027 [Schizophyllum commune H4-8]KAI5836642.1 hypothetical protein SCHCODRAFT_02720027 [Schizophyllum commune H4-8]
MSVLTSNRLARVCQPLAETRHEEGEADAAALHRGEVSLPTRLLAVLGRPGSTISDTLLLAGKALCPRMRIEGVSREDRAQHMRVMSRSWRRVQAGLHRRGHLLLGAPRRSSSSIRPRSPRTISSTRSLLYEGRQIYFGRTADAEAFFPEMGSVKSSYTLSFGKQIGLRVERGLQRLRGDMTNFYVTVFGNSVMALIITTLRSRSTSRMSNLRRKVGPFFLYLYLHDDHVHDLPEHRLCDSHAFPTHALTGDFMLALVIYTSFTIPTRDTMVWFHWIICPIGYAFETIPVMESNGRVFNCFQYVCMGHGYETLSGEEFVCATTGAVLRCTVVYGLDYVNTTYDYRMSGVPLGAVFALRWSRLLKRCGQDVGDAAGGAKFADNNSVG